jgi:LemA protein
VATTENEIAAERMRYNDAVHAYNGFIQSLPHVAYASAAGFRPLRYFDAPKITERVPKIDFGAPAPRD